MRRASSGGSLPAAARGAALALVVAGCGGDDDERRLELERRRARSRRRQDRRGQAGWRRHLPGRRRRRLHGPGPDATTRSATWSSTRSTARCTPSSPTTRQTRCRTSPTASRRSPRTTRRSRSSSRPGVKYAPPVEPRGHLQGHQVRHRARLHDQRPVRLRDVLLRRDRGRPEHAPVKIDELKPFSGLQTPDDQTLVIKLTKAGRPARRRGAGDADHRPGAGGVRRRSSTRRSPTDYDTARRLHRPVHGQERPQDGQAHRP